MMLKIPTLFPMNAGVSLATTDVFPKNCSPYPFKNSKTEASVFGPGMISNNFK